MARSQTGVKKVSSWKLLDDWFFDGRKNTEIPEQVVKDSSIGSHNLLFFFSGTPHGVYISKHFNNYGIYKLDKVEVLHMMKDIIQRTGFVSRFKKRFRNNKTKLFNALWKKFPYLKPDDINLLCTHVDDFEHKESLFEMLGLEKPKKIKNKKTKVKKKPTTAKKPVEKKNSLDTMMGNFTIKE